MADPAYKLCVLIPVFNHEHAMPTLIEQLRPHGVDCLLIDDGSSAACAEVLQRLAAENTDWIRLQTRAENGGKGAAVCEGLLIAQQAGYTHAVQIDADGQHDPDDLPRFRALSQQHPDAVILGKPIYDESVPKHRFYGRYATHVWVWINTISLDIADSMCGYRVYPLAATARLIREEPIGAHMEFDTEIAVRLHWRGVPMHNLGTRVRYPLDGVSHFAMWMDNVRISGMHTRLFFGMLYRLPRLLWRKLRQR